MTESSILIGDEPAVRLMGNQPIFDSFVGSCRLLLQSLPQPLLLRDNSLKMPFADPKNFFQAFVRFLS